MRNQNLPVIEIDDRRVAEYGPRYPFVDRFALRRIGDQARILKALVGFGIGI